MLRQLALILSLILANTTWANSTFFSVEEYLKSHPDQIDRSVSFESYVKNSSRPISIEFSRRIKIAIIYPAIQISDYWRRSVLSFEGRLKELKLPYEIHEYFSRPSVDTTEQEVQIVNALASKPDYLVFTLDAQKHRKLIERILAEGKTKVILQNLTTPLRYWEGHQPFLYVGFDHVIGTQKIADYMINKSNGEGEYAVIFYTPGLVSNQRGHGFIKYLNQKSKLKLSSAFYTDGSKLDGQRVTKLILKKNPNIKFIYTCGTDIALGAIEELKRQKLLGKILINGWGGGSAELESIKNKEMSMTVMRMNDDNGVAMAEAMRFDISGKKEMIPQIFSGEFALIDHLTTTEELKKYEDYAFRYSK